MCIAYAILHLFFLSFMQVHDSSHNQKVVYMCIVFMPLWTSRALSLRDQIGHGLSMRSTLCTTPSPKPCHGSPLITLVRLERSLGKRPPCRLMYGDQARFFDDEKRPHLKHRVRGVVGMASPVPNANASQFYITTGAERVIGPASSGFGSESTV